MAVELWFSRCTRTGEDTAGMEGTVDLMFDDLPSTQTQEEGFTGDVEQRYARR